MKKLIQKLQDKNLVIYLIFAAFFIYLLIQHHYVYIYHDDYGYASLSYAGYSKNFQGSNYGFLDILRYLLWHYNNWGGRILYFLFEILVLKCGVSFMQIIQPCVYLMIFVFMYELIKPKIEPTFHAVLAAIVVLTYGLISINTANLGYYWYTASVLYVWPFCPFFASILLYRKYVQTGTLVWGMAGALCVLASAFSQEQMAILVVIYYGMTMIQTWLTKNIRLRNQIWQTGYFVLSLAGAMLVILAPGNFGRSDMVTPESFKAMSIMEKIERQFPAILSNNFAESSRTEVLAVAAIGLACAYLIYKKKYLQKKVAYCNIGLNFVALAVVITHGPLNAYLLRNIILIVAWLIVLSVNIVYYFVKQAYYQVAWFYLAGGATQVAMVVVYAITTRIHIFFEITLFAIMAYVFCECIIQLYQVLEQRAVIYLMVGYLAVSAMVTALPILKGYRDNAPMNRHNAAALEERRTEVDGNGNQYIHLQTLKDDTYSGLMPYMNGFEYIEPGLRNYYQIDNSIYLKWIKEK